MKIKIRAKTVSIDGQKFWRSAFGAQGMGLPRGLRAVGDRASRHGGFNSGPTPPVFGGGYEGSKVSGLAN